MEALDAGNDNDVSENSGTAADMVEDNTAEAPSNDEEKAPADAVAASVEISADEIDDDAKKPASPRKAALDDPISTLDGSQKDEQQQKEEEDKSQTGESDQHTDLVATATTGASKSDENIASTAASDAQNTTPSKQEEHAVGKETDIVQHIADGEEEKSDKKEAQEKAIAEKPQNQSESARNNRQPSPPKSQQPSPQKQSQPQPQPQLKQQQPPLKHQQVSPARPPSSAPNSSASTEIVHSLFGPTVGLCWGDFSCQYNHVRGRLYASAEAVLFYSNIFGFEKRISLPYDDVLQMQLYRATSIQISVQEKKQQRQDGENSSNNNEIPSTHYVFKGFSDRGQTLQLLIELWRQSQGAENIEAPEEEVENAIDTSASHEVPSSQQAMSLSGVEEAATQLTATNSVTTNPPSILKPSKLSTPPTGSASPATMDVSPAATPSRLFPDISSSSRKRSKSLPQLHRRKNPKRSNSLVGEEEATTSATNDDVDEFKWDEKPSQDDLEAWDSVKKSAHPCIKNVGIKSTTLACSLGTFFKLFLADEAPHSIDKYQIGEAVKDLDVNITPWEQDPSSSDPKGLVRMITFRHPVSSSFGVGPSHAPTRKRQVLRGYPGCGICITNSTTVEGLPGADCFEVKDHWIIEVARTGNGNSQVIFSAKFGANFTKYTFLKGIIHKNIRSGNIEWFTGYKRVVESAVKEQLKNGKDTASSASDTDKDQDESPDNNEGGTGYSKFFQNMPISTGAVLFVAVGSQVLMLLFLFVVVYQMRTSQQTTETLLEELVLLRREHGQMLEVLLAGKATDV